MLIHIPNELNINSWRRKRGTGEIGEGAIQRMTHWEVTLKIDSLVFKALSKQRIALNKKQFFACIITNEINEHWSRVVVPVQDRVSALQHILVIVNTPRHCGVLRGASRLLLSGQLCFVSFARNGPSEAFPPNPGGCRRVGRLAGVDSI